MSISKRIFQLLIFTFFSFSFLKADNAYEIKIKINGFEGKECYLGYFYGDKQYIKDTSALSQDGYFVFKGEEEMPGGVYLVVMPPNNEYFQILLSSGEQHFSIETKKENINANIKVTGSPDNQLFYEYLNFLSAQRPIADGIRKNLEAAGENESEKKKYTEQLDQIDQKVFQYQDALMEKHPKTLTAAIIKSNKPLATPDFKGTPEDVQLKTWYWTKVHYFDNIDLSDPRMLRSPFLFQRVDHYVNKLTAQIPDSINNSIDVLLQKMAGSEDTYKYYLVHFLNYFAKSKVVGFDAVYVHLALNYYKTGKAPWTDADQLQKIVENGEALEPLLIGRVAPNIQMETQQGEAIQLHQMKSPYTVLFFWDPDCGHCKKATPFMLEFHEKFKDRGVEIFGVCTKLVTKNDEGKWSIEEVKTCWDYIEEKGTNLWLNTVDPYHRSRYKSIYDLKTTPQIYVLDKDKKIILKKIGAEQISEVMEQVLEKEKDKS